MGGKKRRWYARWWAIVLWVFLGLTIMGAIGAALEPPTEESAKPTQGSAQEEATPTAQPSTPAPTATPTASTPSPTPRRPSIDEVLRPRFASLGDEFKFKKLEVEPLFNSKGTKVIGKQVTATYDCSDLSFWDENDLVQRLGQAAVDVFRAGFFDRRVARVNAVFLVPMEDAFGNSSLEEGVEIDFTRTLWRNVRDPEAFKDRILVDPEVIYQVATWYSIHPGIWKNTDLKEHGLLAIGGNE